MSMTTNTRNKRAQGPSFGPQFYGARAAVPQLCAQAPGCLLHRAMLGDKQGCKLIPGGRRAYGLCDRCLQLATNGTICYWFNHLQFNVL